MTYKVIKVSASKLTLENNIEIIDIYYAQLLHADDIVTIVDNKIISAECVKKPKKEPVIEEKIIKPEVDKIYLVLKRLFFWGFLTFIIGIGVAIVIISTFILAIQKMREDNLTMGFLFITLGFLSLGIWPAIYTYRFIKSNQKIRVTKNEVYYLKVYLLYKKLHKYLVISMIAIFIYIGIYGIILIDIFLLAQLARTNKTLQGVMVFFLGHLTLGIWPLITIRRELKTLQNRHNFI